MARRIKIPEHFSHREFDEVFKQKDICEKSLCGKQHKIYFDFSKTKYISTLGVLLLAEMADSFAKIDCETFARYGKEEIVAWLLRIMGAMKTPPETQLGKYLDEKRVSIQRCWSAEESRKAINEKLMPIIRQQYKLSEPHLKALNWALWEAIDNAGIHGYKIDPSLKINYPDPVYFCAYAFEDDIEIAILDNGRGFLKSFLDSGFEKYSGISNQQALLLAIKKGESGNPLGSPGFGLYGCAELAKQAGGSLVIISGSHKLYLDDNGVDIYTCYNYSGAIVSLILPMNKPVDLSKIFESTNVIVTEDFDDIFGEFK